MSREWNLTVYDLELLFNAILVDAKVRPAFMVQPIDYGEWLPTEPKTSLIINKIKRAFPDLIYSHDYSHFQGILISKTMDYTGRRDIDNESMGKILGYPCYKEFSTTCLDRDDPSTPDITNLHAISVSVILDKPFKITVPLFTNSCIGTSLLYKFERIAQKAQVALKSDTYADLLADIPIKSVVVECNEILSPSYLLDKLITREELTKPMVDEIINCLWNLNDPEKLSEKIMIQLYEPDNDIHVGLLSAIMLECNNKYARTRPVWGSSSDALAQSNDISCQWFRATEELFKITKKTSHGSHGMLKHLKYIFGKKQSSYSDTLEKISTDPIIHIMIEVLDKLPLSDIGEIAVYRLLQKISPSNKEIAQDILEIYDNTNDIHVGIMTAFLLQCIPRYDKTVPLQQMHKNNSDYKEFMIISDYWIYALYSIFERTSIRISKPALHKRVR